MIGTNETIKDCLRKIIQVDPVLSSSGTKIINGYVSSVGTEGEGTVDVMSRDGQTFVRGVSVSAINANKKGAILMPTINSEVAVALVDGGVEAYLISFSHVSTARIESDLESFIGSTGVEEQNDETDYDEVKDTGYSSGTKYTPEDIESIVKYKDKASKITVTYQKIENAVGEKSKTTQTEEEIKQDMNGTYTSLKDGVYIVKSNKIKMGGEDATENGVLGLKLQTVLNAFIDEVSRIMTVTALGTMPIINIAQVSALKSQVSTILSQVNFLK